MHNGEAPDTLLPVTLVTLHLALRLAFRAIQKKQLEPERRTSLSDGRTVQIPRTRTQARKRGIPAIFTFQEQRDYSPSQY